MKKILFLVFGVGFFLCENSKADTTIIPDIQCKVGKDASGIYIYAKETSAAKDYNKYLAGTSLNSEDEEKEAAEKCLKAKNEWVIIKSQDEHIDYGNGVKQTWVLYVIKNNKTGKIKLPNLIGAGVTYEGTLTFLAKQILNKSTSDL